MKRHFAVLLAVALLLCPLPAHAQQQKPTLRLDVRSAQQAVVIITDPNMAQAKEDIRYLIELDGYRINVSWNVVDVGAIQGGGSIGYYEPSDNSRAVLGIIEYPDGCIATRTERVDDTTLELWLDLSREGLDVRTDESPRDVTRKLRNIDFTTLTGEAKLTCYYDEMESPEYTYTSEEYRYRNKLGLLYVLNWPSFGFVGEYNFGTCAGLTQQEFEQLYLTPKTDNYLVTSSLSTHEYSYGREDYSGDADTYDLMWFDEDGLVLGYHTLFVCKDEGTSMANFRNVETDPRVGDNLERWVGRIPEDDSTASQIVWIYNKEFIEMLRMGGVTKERLLTSLSAGAKVVKNSDGEVHP